MENDTVENILLKSSKRRKERQLKSKNCQLTYNPRNLVVSQELQTNKNNENNENLITSQNINSDKIKIGFNSKNSVKNKLTSLRYDNEEEDNTNNNEEKIFTQYFNKTKTYTGNRKFFDEYAKKYENKEIGIERKKSKKIEESKILTKKTSSKKQNEIISLNIDELTSNNNTNNNDEIEDYSHDDIIKEVPRDKSCNIFQKTNSDQTDIDYSDAQNLYDLSILLSGHKFFQLNKYKDPGFLTLIDRHVFLAEKNLKLLIKNDNNYFIIYQNIIEDNKISLSLNDINILNAVKLLMSQNENLSLLIQFDDLKIIFNKKLKTTEVDEIIKKKLSKIINYLSYKNSTRIHAMSLYRLYQKNYEFKLATNKIKNYLYQDKLSAFFPNLKQNEEAYPLILSQISNPKYYIKYINEFNNDSKCLIIDSIINMNKYQLCFDSAKVNNYSEPVLMAISIIPPLTGFDKITSESLTNNDINLFSDDTGAQMRKKIKNLKNDAYLKYLAAFKPNSNKYEKNLQIYEPGDFISDSTQDELFDIIIGSFINCNKDVKYSYSDIFINFEN